MPPTAHRRRAAALALGVVAVSGLGLASAAQLSISSNDLAAGSVAVGTCQPIGQPVDVTFQSTWIGGQYSASGIQVAGIAATCGSHTLRVQLTTAAGETIDINSSPGLTDQSVVVPAGGGAVTVAITATPVSTIGRAVVLIHS